MVKDYECLTDAQLNGGFDRQVCPPQGILGGGLALSNRMVIKKTDGSEQLLPSKVTDYPVAAGEVISFQTGGGGGYGEPRERDPQSVQRDLRRGLISEGRALAEDGIAIDDSGDGAGPG